jgi:hypothetical protein
MSLLEIKCAWTAKLTNNNSTNGRLKAKRVTTPGSQQGESPPVVLFFTALLLVLVTLILAIVAGKLGLSAANLLGFLTGSVLGTANLAVFLVIDNKRRATRRYSDWTFSPRKVVPYLALIAWTIGAWNVFFWALDLTRP